MDQYVRFALRMLGISWCNPRSDEGMDAIEPFFMSVMHMDLHVGYQIFPHCLFRSELSLDVRLLLDSLPGHANIGTASSTAPLRPLSPSWWPYFPPDAEDTFFFSWKRPRAKVRAKGMEYWSSTTWSSGSSPL